MMRGKAGTVVLRDINGHRLWQLTKSYKTKLVLIGKIGPCDQLQLIAAGRVIDCLTQDPRAVLRYQHEALESNGLTRHDASRSHGAASHGKAEKTESGKLGAAGIPAAETSIKSVPLMRTTANSVEQQ